MSRQDGLYILDIGSGHNPHPNADVLADAYLDNRERGDDAIIDRPFIQADIQNLPFKDNAFDFVNASQVVEHTENPYKAMSELQRVGKSGQVDTPSYLNENVIFGQEFHNYVMLSCFDSAKFVPSTKDDSVMHEVWEKSEMFRSASKMIDHIIPLRVSRYYWGNGKSIHYKLRRQNSNSVLSILSNSFDNHVGENIRMVFDYLTSYFMSDKIMKVESNLKS